MQRFEITGIQVHSAHVSELNNYINKSCSKKKKSLILSGNIHSFNLAAKIPWLKNYLNQADIIRCDGAGIVLGGKLLGYSMKKRITWADYGWELAEYCQRKGLSLFLLGNKENIAHLAAKKMQAKYPDLMVNGTYHGYFQKHGPDSDSVVDMINKSNTQVLLVGLGMPVQEKWLKENYEKLNVNVVMTCGAAFEFLSDTTSRCPKWVGDAGFEWLYRFLLEPRRMFSRYLIGNWLFFLRILSKKT